MSLKALIFKQRFAKAIQKSDVIRPSVKVCVNIMETYSDIMKVVGNAAIKIMDKVQAEPDKAAEVGWLVYDYTNKIVKAFKGLDIDINDDIINELFKKLTSLANKRAEIINNEVANCQKQISIAKSIMFGE
jgi:hypothetical protein